MKTTPHEDYNHSVLDWHWTASEVYEALAAEIDNLRAETIELTQDIADLEDKVENEQRRADEEHDKYETLKQRIEGHD